MKRFYFLHKIQENLQEIQTKLLFKTENRDSEIKELVNKSLKLLEQV